jgi:hypothetical protein
MSRIAAFAITAALLILAPQAAAKAITNATVCGASECRDVEDRALLFTMPDTGDPTEPPRNPSGGWYRTQFEIDAEGHHETFKVAAVPGAGYVRASDQSTGRYVWMPMTDDAADAYRQVVRGLEPLPVSSLRGLNRRTVAPASAPDPAGGFPWEWVAGALGATALAGGGLVTWRRRREAAPTRPGPQAAG